MSKKRDGYCYYSIGQPGLLSEVGHTPERQCKESFDTRAAWHLSYCCALPQFIDGGQSRT